MSAILRWQLITSLKLISAIIVGRLIFNMSVSPEIKTKITACVFYGVSHKEKIDFYKRLNVCKKREKNERVSRKAAKTDGFLFRK